MKDLMSILNGGIVLAAIAIAGWLAIVILFKLIIWFFLFLKAIDNLNFCLTRMNPYIKAHKKMLAEQKKYRQYLDRTDKDGTDILIDPPVFSRYINKSQ